MTASSLMEIKEADIQKHYPQAFQLLSGFDYAPRIGRPAEAPAAAGRSAGIPKRRGFRSTTPGLALTSAPSAGGSVGYCGSLGHGQPVRPGGGSGWSMGLGFAPGVVTP